MMIEDKNLPVFAAMKMYKTTSNGWNAEGMIPNCETFYNVKTAISGISLREIEGEEVTEFMETGGLWT